VHSDIHVDFFFSYGDVHVHHIACVILLQLWMSFSSIADSTAKYFDIDQMQVNWLSIVFMVATIIVGVGAMWMLDHCGLRSTVIFIHNLLLCRLKCTSIVRHWWGVSNL